MSRRIDPHRALRDEDFDRRTMIAILIVGLLCSPLLILDGERGRFPVFLALAIGIGAVLVAVIFGVVG